MKPCVLIWLCTLAGNHMNKKVQMNIFCGVVWDLFRTRIKYRELGCSIYRTGIIKHVCRTGQLQEFIASSACVTSPPTSLPGRNIANDLQ